MLKILPLLIDNSKHLYNAYTETERELKINCIVYITLKASFNNRYGIKSNQCISININQIMNNFIHHS